MLVDSHCHLNYPEFADLASVLQRAAEQGVGLYQTISTKRSDFDEVIDIIENNEKVFGSIGIHPHEAQAHLDITVEELVARAAHPKVIGIGETGLDYYYKHSPVEAQKALFRRHIEAARQTCLPLIVHTRDADEDTIAILHEEYQKGAFTGLIHCFSGSKYLSDNAINIGFLISISGIITFKKSDALRQIVSEIPLDKLLVETDAPYLAPMPHRGKSNEPGFTRYTAEKLAQMLDVDFAVLADKTTTNFMQLFTKVPEAAIR